MINKKMFIGACLLGVSLIFTACSSSSPAFPSQFHGTWVKTGDNTSGFKITGDEFSIKEDGGEYQSLQESLDANEDVKEYKIIQQPTFNDSDQSIVFAMGAKFEEDGVDVLFCVTSYLSKDANEDKLNEYDIPINSVEDPSLTSLAQCKVKPLPDTSSTEPSNEYTKETDDSGGDNSGGNAISITTPTWLRGEWKNPVDSSVCLNVTETEIKLSKDVALDATTCSNLTAISVASVEKNDTTNYELTLAVEGAVKQCNFVHITAIPGVSGESVAITCPGHNFLLPTLNK